MQATARCGSFNAAAYPDVAMTGGDDDGSVRIDRRVDFRGETATASADTTSSTLFHLEAC